MNGESISSLARETGVDRRTLKNKILEILSDDEKVEFEQKLNSNFKRNRVSVRNAKRKNREVSYKQGIHELVLMGITDEDIEIIFRAISSNKHTAMAKDTFVSSLIEIFNFVEERNIGLRPDSKGYITKEDVINMILKQPKFMTNDVRGKIKPMCDIFDGCSSKDQVNQSIKQYPEIFKNSIKRVKEHLIIGDYFLVKTRNRFMKLSEYIILEKPHLFSENSSKFLDRVCTLKNGKSSGILDEEDLNGSFKRSKKHFELPDYKDDESLKKIIEDIINGEKEEVKKGEEK